MRRSVKSIGDLAVVLRARRLDLGFTQVHLAELCGVTRKTINDIEASRLLPRWSLLLLILEQLGLDLRIEPREGDEASAPGPAAGGHVDLDALLKRQAGR